MRLKYDLCPNDDHLSAVVEVPVRHLLLRGQLPQLVQQDVELVLGLEVGQPPVTETLNLMHSTSVE